MKTAREIALVVLRKVLVEEAYANIALQQVFTTWPAEDRERRFATEIIYGVIRKKNYLEWILGRLSRQPLAKLDADVRLILLCALYQIIFLNSVPARAAINEAVEMTKKVSHRGSAGFVNGCLRSYLRKQEEFNIPQRTNDPITYLSLTYCQPKWFAQWAVRTWGMERTEELFAYFMQPAPLTVRVNTLLETRDEVIRNLTSRGVDVVKLAVPEGLSISRGGIAAIREELQSGILYVQDEAAMWVAHAVSPQPGETILDLCAAPGGKTTHLAQIMENQGEIIACDLYSHKQQLIWDNCKRLGVTIVSAVVQDATKENPDWQKKFDKVLVDAPCSGLGVIGRRPDLKWRRTSKELKDFPLLQQAIVERAVTYLKPGGRLVYSTCTLNPEENEGVRERISQAHPQLQPCTISLGNTIDRDEYRFWPPESKTDGFYICAWENKI